MEKEIRRLQYLFSVVFILCVIWLTAHYTGKYYEIEYRDELKSAEIAYYQAIFERDTYAYMYYKEIGNEEMAKTFEKSNIFERKNE